MGMIQQHSLFGPGAKYVKFHESGLSLVEAANTAAKLPLNDLRIPYDQYARSKVIIPKDARAKKVNVPMLGEAVTFLLLKPIYDKNNRDITLNTLRYKLGENAPRSYTMAEVLLLTGSPTEPVPAIYIDNLNKDYGVVLEVFTCTAQYDATNDGGDFNVFLRGLVYTDLRSADEYTTAVYQNAQVEMYFSNEVLVTVEREGMRLIFDDPALGRVCLEFINELDARHALANIRWMLNSPATRQLTATTPRDTDAPVVTFKPVVKMTTAGQLYANLVLPMLPVVPTPGSPTAFTKALLLTTLVATVVDDRDGNILLSQSDIVIKDAQGMTYAAIDGIGRYTVTVSAKDVAGNITAKSILVTTVDADVTPPVFTQKPAVVSGILEYVKQGVDDVSVTKAKLVEDIILSCIDDVDGAITVNAGHVTVTNSVTGEDTNFLTYPGVYEVYFDVADAAGNEASLFVEVTLNLS